MQFTPPKRLDNNNEIGYNVDSQFRKMNNQKARIC